MAEKRKYGIIEHYDTRRRSGRIRGTDGRNHYFHKDNFVNIANPEVGIIVSFVVPSKPNSQGKIELSDIRQEALIPEQPSPPASVNKNIIQNESTTKVKTTQATVQKPNKEKEIRISLPRNTAAISDYIHFLIPEIQAALAEEGIDSSNIYSYKEPHQSNEMSKTIDIDSRVSDAFRKAQTITTFYAHQVRARQILQSGKSIIISTPTASGKTEAYNPTILETLVKDRDATALYLFPLNALAFDQTDRLQRLNQELPVSDQITIGVYNQNTPQEHKNEVLSKKIHRILVTTPDSLHHIFLPKPWQNWKEFYKNLRYVVIDEAHIYRGIFGANMANIIRRLLVRCKREGNPGFPQFIISSATVHNPERLAHQLTGLSDENFELIDKSGAPTSGRHFLVTRSGIPDLITLCSELLNVKRVNLKPEESEYISTIVFLRSIKEVQRSKTDLQKHLDQNGRHDQRHLVEEFYSDKGNKSDILIRLRKGAVRCLFTTTALMAGIDVGSLDVSIVKGFPGLIMDARQMFGRAGRSREGAVIFIANRTDPFDQFYFHKPNLLFEGNAEDVIANPENPKLLEAHLKCAAQTNSSWANHQNHEGPLLPKWVNLFGNKGKEVVKSLGETGELTLHSDGYHCNEKHPHENEAIKDIRATSNEIYILIANNKELEKKRDTTAFRDAHKDAILRINETTYQVVNFDKASRKIYCQPIKSDELHTQGLEEVEINVLETDQTGRNVSLPNGIATIGFGSVQIATSVKKYLVYRTRQEFQCSKRSCNFKSSDVAVHRCPKCGSKIVEKQVNDIEDKKDIQVPPVLSKSMNTRAAWININEKIREKFETEFWPRWDSANGFDMSIIPTFEFSIHSLEHAILKAFPEHIYCDRDEIGGFYKLMENGQPTQLFFYDNYPGGLGQSETLGENHISILEGALNIIERCICTDDQGCPNCISYFGCRSFNQSLSKLAGRYLLNLLLGKSTAKVLADLTEFVEYNKQTDERVYKSKQE